MSDGATTTGSIDAKLGIDKTAWNVAVRETKTESAELGALNPEIKVDANVAEALAKLEALQMAERKLRIAELDLDKVQKDRGATQQQLLRAQNALSSATIGYQNLAQRLTTEREKDAQATARQESVVRRFSDALDQNTESGRRGRVGLQALVFLSPAIVGAIAPIGAAAIGLAGAFGGMAAAGVLAVIGIKKEMDAGTTTGNAYASGLASLKTVLDSLGKTAAVSMLGSFQQATATITANLPALNSQIGTFTGLLGKIGTTALDGLITGLRVANPLFQAAGLVVLDLVEKFNQFTASTGFSQFVTYAVGQLPLVMNFLGQTGTLVMNLVQAFAPLGQVTISVLSGLIGMLNSVPLPVLAGLVTTVTSLGVAFKIAPAVIAAGQAIGVFGSMAQLAVPVVGILLAALAGLGAAALSASASQNQATYSVQSFTQALKDDSNAIGEHTRAQVARALADSNAAAAAQALGISSKTLTDASLGNKDAIESVNESLETAKGTYDNAGTAVLNFLSNGMGMSVQQRDTEAAVKLVTDALEKNKNGLLQGQAANAAEAQALGVNQTALQQLAAQYGVSVSAYQNAKDQQQKTKDQLDATTLSMQLQNNAAGLLKQAWDEFNGKTLSVEQSQTRAGQATNSLISALQLNNAEIRGNTDAALSNQSVIQSKVQADQAAAQAVADQTKSTQAGTQAFGESKAALEASLRSQGLLTGEVQAYINKLYDVNNFKPKPVDLEVKSEAAQAAVDALQYRLSMLKNKTIYVDVQSSESVNNNPPVRPGQIGMYASGDLVKESPINYLASGGSPWPSRGTDSVPAMLTPGEFVVKQPAVSSVGLSALRYINQTGQLPESRTDSPGPITVQLVLDGQVLDSRIVNLANLRVEAGFREANDRAQRRPSR